MLARDEDILKAAEDWRKAGRGVALATVVETWGSAPRPVGSNLVIDKDGNFLGSVSGGCALDATAGDAAEEIALVVDHQVRADRPRRRAPGLDHGRERNTTPGRLPVLGGFQDVGFGCE